MMASENMLQEILKELEKVFWLISNCKNQRLIDSGAALSQTFFGLFKNQQQLSKITPEYQQLLIIKNKLDQLLIFFQIQQNLIQPSWFNYKRWFIQEQQDQSLQQLEEIIENIEQLYTIQDMVATSLMIDFSPHQLMECNFQFEWPNIQSLDNSGFSRKLYLKQLALNGPIYNHTITFTQICKKIPKLKDLLPELIQDDTLFKIEAIHQQKHFKIFTNNVNIGYIPIHININDHPLSKINKVYLTEGMVIKLSETESILVERCNVSSRAQLTSNDLHPILIINPINKENSTNTFLQLRHSFPQQEDKVHFINNLKEPIKMSSFFLFQTINFDIIIVQDTFGFYLEQQKLQPNTEYQCNIIYQGGLIKYRGTGLTTLSLGVVLCGRVRMNLKSDLKRLWDKIDLVS